MAHIVASVVTSTLHPIEAVKGCLSIDFDFDGCVLCDDESLHADLAALFERRVCDT